MNYRADMTVTFATQEALVCHHFHHDHSLILPLDPFVVHSLSDSLHSTPQHAITRTMSLSSSWSRYDENNEDEENENILTDAQEVRPRFPDASSSVTRTTFSGPFHLHLNGLTPLIHSIWPFYRPSGVAVTASCLLSTVLQRCSSLQRMARSLSTPR